MKKVSKILQMKRSAGLITTGRGCCSISVETGKMPNELETKLHPSNWNNGTAAWRMNWYRLKKIK